MSVAALFPAIMGGSNHRCRRNRDGMPWQLVVGLALLFGVLLMVVLVVCVACCGTKRMARKDDVEAQGRNVATGEGASAGARNDSFESIELREVGVEGPP